MEEEIANFPTSEAERLDAIDRYEASLLDYITLMGIVHMPTEEQVKMMTVRWEDE